MWSLEDNLTPAGKEPHTLRDAMALAPVALLTLMLLPGWSTPDVYVTDVASQIASPHLLTALAMLLALRVGTIDLSVWVVAAGATLLSAAAVTAGFRPITAFSLSVAVGAGVGAVNALCVCRRRLPSPVVTLLVAFAVMGVCRVACPGGRIDVPEKAFTGWLLDAPVSINTSDDGDSGDVKLPLILSRTILVAAVYAAAMLAMLPWRPSSGPSPWRRAGALVAAGALAALSGAIRVMDLDAATPPGRAIGDLRIPAAALLAGGVLPAGPGRTLVCGAVLPVALLAATMWQQQTWMLGVWGVEWQVGLLILLTVLIHLTCQATYRWRGPRRLIAATAWMLTMAAMALIAASTLLDAAEAARTARRWGLAAGNVAALLLAVGWRLTAPRPRPLPSP